MIPKVMNKYLKKPFCSLCRRVLYGIFQVIQGNKIWRDRLGIEPSGDGTRLPEGFEDLGVHQHRNRPHNHLYFTRSGCIMQAGRIIFNPFLLIVILTHNK